MSSTGAEVASPRSVWGRDFTLYFVGVVLSLSGYWVRFVAQGALVYELTGSSWQLGLVGFFTTLPVLLCSPLAGVAVDRIDRRRLLGLTQGGFLLVVAALALLDSTGRVEVWHVMALAFVGGIVSAFDWPTRLALVPNLVEPALLPRAVALNSAAWNGARIGGPVIGGLLLPLVGTAGAFWVAAAMFLPVLAMLPFIRLRSGGERRSGGNLLATLRGGYAYVLGSSLLVTLLLVELVPTVLGQTFPILMPAFAAEVLGGEPQLIGWLIGALGVGELLGTLIVALARVPRRPIVVLVGVAAFGVTMILFALSSWLWLSLLFLVLAGLFGAAYSTLNGVLIQATIEDEYRGRVMGVYSMIWGLTPIGSVQLGALAQLFGPAVAVTVNGALVIACALLVVLRWPQVRKL